LCQAPQRVGDEVGTVAVPQEAVGGDSQAVDDAQTAVQGVPVVWLLTGQFLYILLIAH
jgi:hypothetical protein